MLITLVVLGVLIWHVALYYTHRVVMLHKVEASWALAHKLGKVAGMMSPEWVDAQLRSAGIDPSMLPRA